MTASGAPLEVLGFAVAVIMAVGSAFAATNTMYAAVARRSREIGTLRALGFGRAAILFSFITESVCLSFLGGLLGVFLALPIDGWATGVGNFSTFTDVTFKFRQDSDILYLTGFEEPFMAAEDDLEALGPKADWLVELFVRAAGADS